MFQSYFYPLGPNVVAGTLNSAGVADAPQLGTRAKFKEPMALAYLPSAFKVIVADRGKPLVAGRDADCCKQLPHICTAAKHPTGSAVCSPWMPPSVSCQLH
jgi:hypothetical protein